jgi:hypothetical protein
MFKCVQNLEGLMSCTLDFSGQCGNFPYGQKVTLRNKSSTKSVKCTVEVTNKGAVVKNQTYTLGPGGKEQMMFPDCTLASDGTPNIFKIVGESAA